MSALPTTSVGNRPAFFVGCFLLSKDRHGPRRNNEKIVGLDPKDPFGSCSGDVDLVFGQHRIQAAGVAAADVGRIY